MQDPKIIFPLLLFHGSSAYSFFLVFFLDEIVHLASQLTHPFVLPFLNIISPFFH